jgi:hypothetical protein
MPTTLIVLPRASRFDHANSAILSGPARRLVDETLGADNYDVCYAADYRRDSPHTHVILTGQDSSEVWFPGKPLNAARGYVLHAGARRIISTFWPQDCVDIKDYESHIDEIEEDQGTGKDSAPTRRGNYRFWFKRDCEKVFRPPVLRHGHSYCPIDASRGAQLLQSARDKLLYFDIETHPDTETLQCFSFAIDNGPVYTCGVYDWNGCLREGAVALVAALSRAFSRNKVVIHNASFDLLFLAMYHGIPFGTDIEDTMLIGHRIWPEAEKSLAHDISLYTNLPFHKDEGGTWHPRNHQQYDKLLRYNAKDVYALREVYLGQRDYIRQSTVSAGLMASVSQVNDSIFPYLYTSLHGLPINPMALINHTHDCDIRAAQYRRITSTLAGYDLNPGSSQQLGQYFTEGMRYPVLDRTETGNVKADETILYKYLLKHRNPLVSVILKYKRARKVLGELGLRTWQPLMKR